MEVFFGGIVLEKFFGRIFERIFGRNYLFTLVCQDFGFCQDFVSIKKEGRRARNLDP